MHRRALVLLVSLLFATGLFAKDVYLSISGKANGFFADARIFNPSYTKDIIVTARYLPVGNGNNSGAAGVQLTIPKRSMAVYDDAVQSIFGGGPTLGAIRLTSDDDFVATQRIYQDARTGPQAGTLGQFVPGLDISTAKTKGVMLQLKAGQAAIGSFRTNWGGVNPNASVANISFQLYDKNNALAGTNNLTIQPFGTISPTNIVGFFGNPSSDLTDAWISFQSDVPVFLYCSIIDNGSVDATYVPASDDTGVAPPPPDPEEVTVNVTARNWNFTLEGADNLKPGDIVTFNIRSAQDLHGFQLFSPGGQSLASIEPIGANATQRTITLPEAGTYTIICTRTICGAGHEDMNITFDVMGGTTPGDRY